MYVKEAIFSDETRLTTDYYHFVIKIFPGRIESCFPRTITHVFLDPTIPTLLFLIRAQNSNRLLSRLCRPIRINNRRSFLPGS